MSQSNPNPPTPTKIGEFNDESLRQIAKEIIIRKTVLKVHWIAFLLVNASLAFINIYGLVENQSFSAYLNAFGSSNQAETLWHFWASACWGLALLIHSFNFITYRKGMISTSAGGIMAYHAFIYLSVSALLFFINWFTLLTLNWAFWPFGFWGFAVIMHFLFYNSHKPKKAEDKRKSWMDRQIDMELSRVKKN